MCAYSALYHKWIFCASSREHIPKDQRCEILRLRFKLLAALGKHHAYPETNPLGNTQLAVKLLEEALGLINDGPNMTMSGNWSLNPVHDEVRHNLGAAWSDLGVYGCAKLSFNKALEIQQNH